jgi:hypothetical protein
LRLSSASRIENLTFIEYISYKIIIS